MSVNNDNTKLKHFHNLIFIACINFADEISVEAGFKVQIHAQAEPPFIHELGFGISPGFQRLVATQEQRVKQRYSRVEKYFGYE